MKMNYCNDECNVQENTCCNMQEKNLCCGCGEGRTYSKCFQLSPCPHPILFEASCGLTTSVPASYVVVYDPKGPREGHPGKGHSVTPIKVTPKSVACMNLDTSCLKSPTTIIEFETQIFLKFKDEQHVPARIDFELVKCENGCESVCGTWTYSHLLCSHCAEDEITEMFSFTKVDAASCPGCANYSVRIINTINNPLEVLIFDIRNANISAIAKSGC